ncbi:hypothetical protein ECIV_ORF70 [European chub iridovirus]|nr:hypothetical protein ECIV_ORF70 [European chub iridovirus]
MDELRPNVYDWFDESQLDTKWFKGVSLRSTINPVYTDKSLVYNNTFPLNVYNEADDTLVSSDNNPFQNVHLTRLTKNDVSFARPVFSYPHLKCIPVPTVSHKLCVSENDVELVNYINKQLDFFNKSMCNMERKLKYFLEEKSFELFEWWKKSDDRTEEEMSTYRTTVKDNTAKRRATTASFINKFDDYIDAVYAASKANVDNIGNNTTVVKTRLDRESNELCTQIMSKLFDRLKLHSSAHSEQLETIVKSTYNDLNNQKFILNEIVNNRMRGINEKLLFHRTSLDTLMMNLHAQTKGTDLVIARNTEDQETYAARLVDIVQKLATIKQRRDVLKNNVHSMLNCLQKGRVHTIIQDLIRNYRTQSQNMYQLGQVRGANCISDMYLTRVSHANIRFQVLEVYMPKAYKNKQLYMLESEMNFNYELIKPDGTLVTNSGFEALQVDVMVNKVTIFTFTQNITEEGLSLIMNYVHEVKLKDDTSQVFTIFVQLLNHTDQVTYRRVYLKPIQYKKSYFTVTSV